MQWHMQAENITTNIMVKGIFTLPAPSTTNFVTWKCYMNEYDKGRFNNILELDILKELVSNLKWSEHFI